VTLFRKNVLLLGAKGFVGQHMKELLVSKGHNVFQHGSETDVRNYNPVLRAVNQCEPDWAISFAGITTVREAFLNPETTQDTAFLGTFNLLKALKEERFSGRVLNISSSEVYGHPHVEDLPLTETSQLKPVSPYSVAKLSTEFLCFQWSQSEKMDILTAKIGRASCRERV